MLQQLLFGLFTRSRLAFHLPKAKNKDKPGADPCDCGPDSAEGYG